MWCKVRHKILCLEIRENAGGIQQYIFGPIKNVQIFTARGIQPYIFDLLQYGLGLGLKKIH